MRTLLTLQTLIVVAGITNLIVAGSSIAIPFLLGWREELRRLSPLTRQVFWTYASYTLGIHVWFGILSIAAARELAGGGKLAAFVCGFIAVYWGARIAVQFAHYDRGITRGNILYRLGEVAYVSAFLFMTIVYAVAAMRAM